jgi:methionyl-tRNA formyltransferase
MRIVFWGSSSFSCPILETIHVHGHEIIYVITSPEKPQGRGLKVQSNPVRILAEKLGLNVLTPLNPNSEEVLKLLQKSAPEICVLSAYGFIISEFLLSIPPKGFINIHPSLLPKYRGPAPIQRALMNGEKITGVSVFFMTSKVDAGDIIVQKAVDINIDETYDELLGRLAKIASELIIYTLWLLKSGQKIITTPQNENEKSYAPKIKKEECQIQWNRSKLDIHNLVRGLSSDPGAYTYFHNRRVKILRTKIPENGIDDIIRKSGLPGKIVVHNKRLFVETKDSLLEILVLQLEGARKINALDFINGQRLTLSDFFECK